MPQEIASVDPLDRAVLDLLCSLPARWRDIEIEDLTSAEQTAIALMTRASLVEERVRFRLWRSGKPGTAECQARVTGEVSMLLRPGQVFVEGVASPHSLLAATRGTYGEAAGEWTAADALGFSRMRCLPGMLYTRAGGDGEG